MVDLGQKRWTLVHLFSFDKISFLQIKKANPIEFAFTITYFLSLFCLSVTSFNLIPVDDIKKRINVIWSSILIVQIVSVFPNIQS